MEKEEGSAVAHHLVYATEAHGGGGTGAYEADDKAAGQEIWQIEGKAMG